MGRNYDLYAAADYGNAIFFQWWPVPETRQSPYQRSLHPRSLYII